MPLHPAVYAEMLGKKMLKHNVNVWMVNTGWTGGPYNEGKRIKLSFTRAMITAALEGKLDNIETETEPVFGFQIPKSIPGVPENILNPRNTWADKNIYDKKANLLAELFIRNFEKYHSVVSCEIMNAAPSIL